MSNVKIWIHAVWETENRQALLTLPVRKILLPHIVEYSQAKGIAIDVIGGQSEHLHALFCLPTIFSCSEVMQILKDESAFWLNKNFTLPNPLQWNESHIAVSVSESMKDAVKQYIANQDELHRKKDFAQEHDEFMDKFGF